MSKRTSVREWTEWVEQDVVEELCEIHGVNKSDFVYDDEAMSNDLYHMIDMQCTYYTDCWDIAKLLSGNTFTIESTGEVAKDICQLAFFCLLELAEETLYFSFVKE